MKAIISCDGREIAMGFLRSGLILLLWLLNEGGLGAALLDDWRWSNPLPQGNDLHALVHANGRFVAVGDHGSVLRSFDGMSWNVHNLEIDVTFRSVAFGNGVFVTLGNDTLPLTAPTYAPQPLVFRSVDGANWNSPPSSVLPRMYASAVAYGNGVFVIVGAQYWFPWTNTLIFSSTDGEFWTDRSPPITNSLFDVAFGNGQFVAVGDGSSGPAIVTSPDGVNWTSRDAPASGSPSLVAYGNGRFVAVGNIYSAAVPFCTSEDGVTWARSEFTSPQVLSPNDLSFVNGMFILMARGYPEPHTMMFASPDGVSWSPRNIGAATNLFLNVVAHSGERFAAVGEHGNIAWSSDGANWTAYSGATDNNLRGVAYGDGRFVAVGNNGTNLTSTDGVNWTGHAAGTTRNLREVSWTGDQFIAVGSHGTILRSVDGAAWAPASSGTTEDLWDVASGNGTYVAVGGDSIGDDDGRLYRFAILSSSDSQNWTTRLSTPGYVYNGLELHGVAYGNGRFVAVGRPHALLTSVDGITWVTNQTAPWFYYLKDITYANGMFVAVGESTNALVSVNGLNWTERPLPVPPFTEMDDVAYLDGTFVAVGDSGIIVSSLNGFDWERRHSATDTSLRGVTYGKGTAVIVGNNDLILQAGSSNATPTCDPLQNWFSTTSGTNLVLNDVTFGAGRFVAVGTNGSIATSTNSVVWSNQVVFGLPVLNGVAYGNERFVAVGLQGLARWSTNGSLWNIVAVGGAPNFSSIAFGGDRFVAVTTNGTIWVTTNGINFGPIPVSSGSFSSIAYGNGRFVAVTPIGTSRVSTDATNWTVGIPAAMSFADVTFGRGVFVAVGPGGRLARSPDGLDWAMQDSGTASDLGCVVYGDGRFVAVHRPTSGQAAISVSTDGGIWEVLPLPLGSPMNDIAFGNESFVAVGQNGSILGAGRPLVILRQPSSQVVCAGDVVNFFVDASAGCPVTYQWQLNGVDLVEETASALSFTAVMPEHAGEYSVVISDGKDTLVSLPAVLQLKLCRAVDHWAQPAPLPGTNTLNGIVCAGGQLVAVGAGGTIFHSLGGTSWTASLTATNVTLAGVAYGAGQYVAVGFNGVILTSSNAVEWMLQSSGTNRPLRAVAYGVGLFVTVGDQGLILSSPDGISWTPRESGTNRTLVAIIHAEGQFVAVGAGGVILTSPDAAAWTVRPTGVVRTLLGVAGGGGVFVAVGNGGILRSTNAVDWVPSTSPATGILNGVVFAHGQFVAVGADGTVLSSPDGTTWALRESGTAADLMEVISCGDTFFTVGVGGIIQQSAFAGAPILTGRRRSELGFELGIKGEIGAPFRLLATPTLPGGWQEVLNFTNLRASTTIVDSTATNSQQRFYRVVSP